MKFLLLSILICLSSCVTYYDNYHGFKYEEYSLVIGNEVNTFYGLERIPGKADTEIYYPQKFSIDLPKSIKGLAIYGNHHVFEYDKRQFISIDAGYSNKNLRPENWQLKDPSENELGGIRNYYEQKKYSENIFDKEFINRKTVVYTNGEVKIILFNVKQDNFEQFFSPIKNFKYLE